jgi:hypothetical protein
MACNALYSVAGSTRCRCILRGRTSEIAEEVVMAQIKYK